MSDTPRTDAEHAKTLTPAYEHIGAETEAWEWARTLEKEAAHWKAEARAMAKEVIRLNEPLPFSELF